MREAQYLRLCERDGVIEYSSGYDPHHCFFRSEYRGFDRDEDWNYVLISRAKHNLIHHAGNKEESEKGKKLNAFLKKMAFDRYKGKNREALAIILKRHGIQ